MNVIVSNENKEKLSNLDIDVIKSISGEFEVDELVAMFKNFFYDKMILDMTAVEDYEDTSKIQKLVENLGAEKLVLLLPDELCSSNYLSSIISMGVYNFTNNINAIKQLLDRPNTYEDVEKIAEISNAPVQVANRVRTGIENKIIGFKNITEHAGSTSLVYMLKKELASIYGNSVYAIEVNKSDFEYFPEKNMFSVSEVNLDNKISELNDASVILIDLNDCRNTSLCGDVIYLLEPSTIMLNKLISNNRMVFDRLKGKKIVLNKSLLSNKDVTEFEYEANTKIYYNLAPVNDREKSSEVNEFMYKLGLVDDEGIKQDSFNKAFNIFKR